MLLEIIAMVVLAAMAGPISGAIVASHFNDDEKYSELQRCSYSGILSGFICALVVYLILG